MNYVKTNWVNGITPVNASNMNKIEDELEVLDNQGLYLHKITNDNTPDVIIFVTNFKEELEVSSDYGANKMTIPYLGEDKVRLIISAISGEDDGYSGLLYVKTYGIVDYPEGLPVDRTYEYGLSNIKRVTENNGVLELESLHIGDNWSETTDTVTLL